MKTRRTPLIPMTALLLSLLLYGCTSTPQEEKYYYTLRYNQQSEQTELIQSEALDLRVWVRDASVSRSYKRKQIVVRHFGPRISYLERHLWANELEDKIPELVTKRLEAYNLFRAARREFPYTRPDYELITTLSALEFIRGGGTPKALLNMRFDLRQLQGGSVVSMERERQIPVYDSNLDSFVQVINEAILEEADQLARTILAEFGRIDPGATQSGTQIEPAERTRVQESAQEVPQAGEQNNGQLLLPGLFTGREQPLYTIIDRSGEERLGRFGTPVDLPPGQYTIRYGSGSLNRRMSKNVRVREGYRTIVEPDYGGMRVEAITPNGRAVEIAYELYDSATGNSYGTGYTAEGVSDWEEQIWVLPVGRYKVTINNQAFAANRDYAAVYVERGEGNILTLSVVEEEESNRYRVVGGGVIKEPLYAEEDERWILNSSIAGNVAGTLNNTENASSYSAGFSLNGFLQNRVRYDYAPLDFSMRNLIELGATRSAAGSFEISRDAAELDSTLVIDLLLNLGLYFNGDVSTHLFPSYFRKDSPFNYEKYGADGSLNDSGSSVEEVRTAPPFLPLELQEGVGLNISLAEEPRLEASARFGLGLRQTIYGDAYPTLDTESSPVRLEQKADEFTTGLEGSLQFSSRFLQDFTYSTRFEAYAPFTDLEDLALEWSHDLQLSLWRNFTIDYRASLYNTTDADGKLYIGTDHAIYLRFSTIYRLSF